MDRFLDLFYFITLFGRPLLAKKHYMDLDHGSIFGSFLLITLFVGIGFKKNLDWKNGSADSLGASKKHESETEWKWVDQM